MRVSILSTTIVSLSLWCAGALADVNEALIPGPSTASPSIPESSSSPPRWTRLLRRNVQQMLQTTKGIRSEDEVKQLDLVTWAKDTTQVCMDKIPTPVRATNPAGVVICYDIPLVVDSVFAVDIRLFKVAEPQAEWKDVNGFELKVRYKGAATAPRNISDPEKAAAAEAKAPNSVSLIQSNAFIGSIQPQVLAGRPSDEELKVILTPNITLVGKTPSGRELTTQVSTEGMKFLTGVFSETRDLSREEVENAPFELPGTKIEIVPAGLYLFGSYMLLACLIFGWGTMDRARFRDQYRKRMAASGPR